MAVVDYLEKSVCKFASKKWKTNECVCQTFTESQSKLIKRELENLELLNFTEMKDLGSQNPRRYINTLKGLLNNNEIKFCESTTNFLAKLFKFRNQLVIKSDNDLSFSNQSTFDQKIDDTISLFDNQSDVNQTPEDNLFDGGSVSDNYGEETYNQEEMNAVKDELEKVKKQMKTEQTDRTTVLKKLDIYKNRLNQYNSKHNSEIKSRDAKISELTQQLEDKNSELVNQSEKIEELTQQLEEKNSELVNQSEKIEELTRQLGDKNYEFVNQSEKIEELTRQLEEKESKIEDHFSTLSCKKKLINLYLNKFAKEIPNDNNVCDQTKYILYQLAENRALIIMAKNPCENSRDHNSCDNAHAFDDMKKMKTQRVSSSKKRSNNKQ